MPGRAVGVRSGPSIGLPLVTVGARGLLVRAGGLGGGLYEVVLQAFQRVQGRGALVGGEVRGHQVFEPAPALLDLTAQGMAGGGGFDE